MPITKTKEPIIANSIADCVPIEKIFVKDKWFVVLDRAYNGKRKMANANYVWLKCNPAFKEVPKGYVIHHLDWDKTNDDISNLVIMQKYHHVAHHWKQKTNTPTIRVSESDVSRNSLDYFPTKKPAVGKRTDRETYYIAFRERVNGKLKPWKLGSMFGKTLKTREQAEHYSELLWKNVSGDGL